MGLRDPNTKKFSQTFDNWGCVDVHRHQVMRDQGTIQDGTQAAIESLRNRVAEYAAIGRAQMAGLSKALKIAFELPAPVNDRSPEDAMVINSEAEEVLELTHSEEVK
jgi:hypothetical protein